MNGFARALHLLGTGAGAPLRAAVVRLATERGLQPVLVDLDPWSGGSDVLLGLEHVPGVRWHDLDGADGDFDADGLLHRLPCGALGERVLAHDRWAARPVPAQVVRAALHALRLSAGLLILDGGKPVDMDEVHREGDRTWVTVGADVRSGAAGVAASQWLSRQGFAHRTVLVQSGAAVIPEELVHFDARIRIGRVEQRDLDHGVLCGRRRSALREQAGRMLDEVDEHRTAA